jgi:methylenetetrahydrofolate reductase (NADPH)
MTDDFSFETVARRAGELADVRDLLPPGTRIAIPHLDGDDLPGLVEAAHAVRELGFVPVPHLAARRLESAAGLVALRAATDQLFVVGGDPVTPRGPFPDALALIRSGLLARHGFRAVGLPGYPSGHPSVDDARLWADLLAKTASVREQGLAGSVTTQFATTEAVLAWLAEARRRGVDLPVRMGVPGPGGLSPALAARLGVPADAAGHLDRPEGLKIHLSPFGALREAALIVGRHPHLIERPISTGSPQFRHTVSAGGPAIVPA